MTFFGNYYLLFETFHLDFYRWRLADVKSAFAYNVDALPAHIVGLWHLLQMALPRVYAKRARRDDAFGRGSMGVEIYKQVANCVCLQRYTIFRNSTIFIIFAMRQ